jgi:membrane associated rhomboid family serine protease
MATTSHQQAKPRKSTAVYALIMANFCAFLLDSILHVPIMKSLYLYHDQWTWWQPLTCAFCHANHQHLSGNIFLLLLFGRSVEDDLGGAGLYFSFAFCAIGASLASLFLLPTNTISIGASGAVFGLFTVSIFSRLAELKDWRKVIEVAVLGEFVLSKMLSEVKVAASGGIAGVNHVAHLAGAGSGIALVVLLHSLVGGMEKGHQNRKSLST